MNASYFLKNNRLNNRDFNIDQNNRDYDLFSRFVSEWYLYAASVRPHTPHCAALGCGKPAPDTTSLTLLNVPESADWWLGRGQWDRWWSGPLPATE